MVSIVDAESAPYGADIIMRFSMSEMETEQTYAELDRLLNDPEVRMDASRVWTLLDRLAGSGAVAPAGG